MKPADLIAYVDIDDTLVRSVGPKRIPMIAVVEHVKSLHGAGVTLYCWSSGGGEYARASARELGIETLFAAYLPKPHVLIDDQAPSEWTRVIHIHPAEAPGRTADEYVRELQV